MAKTKVELGQTWNCNLKLINANFTGTSYAPVTIVSFQAMNCRAEIVRIEEQRVTKSAHEHALNDPPPPGQGPNGCWVGSYYHYEVQLIAPEMMGEYIIPLYIWLGDNWSPITNIPGLAFPAGSVVCDTDEFTLNVSISVQGLFLKATIEDLSPDDRNKLNFTDEAVDYKWYSDGNTRSTLTVSGGGISETRTGSFGTWNKDEEVDILIGSTFGCQYSIGLKVGYEGYKFAAISDIKWGPGSVATNGIEKLYSTNGSTWSRTLPGANYWYFYSDSNAIIPMRHGTTVTTGAAWLGTSVAPYIVKYHMTDESTNYFDQAGQAAGMVYLSNYIIWDDEDTYHLEPVSNGLVVTQAASSWNEAYPSEWQKLTSRSIIVYEREADRLASGDNLGDPDSEDYSIATNDAQCQIPIPKLDATDLTLSSYGGCFWANFGSIVHTTSQNVNDPPTAARPSLWTSTDITVDGTNNDLWTLGTNSTTNFVHRDLKTRYYDRMARLAGGYVPGDEYSATWIWAVKANIDLDDDPDWETSIPYEDIVNWSNYKYVNIDMTSEIAGTVTMQIQYDVPTITDPFYSCASYRWEEFEYDLSSYVLSWTFDIVVGANSVLLDMTCNDQKVVPVKDRRIFLVKTITFELPNNPDTENTKNIELNQILLTLDPGDNTRSEPSTHIEIRSKTNWQWYSNHGVGIHCYVDGLPAAELDYGQIIDQEYGITSIDRVEHCPTTQDQSYRLDSARIASQFMDFDYCEGFEASSNYLSILQGSSNVDEDDVALCPAFYFWDFQPDLTQTAATTIQLNGCKQVGTYRIAAGTQTDIWVVKHPRGRLHGISFNSDQRLRKRSEDSGVTIYGKKDTDAGYTLRQTGINTDEHGRWISHEFQEQDYSYKINNSTLSVYTREYTSKYLNLVTFFDPHFTCDEDGLLLMAVSADDVISFRVRSATEAEDWNEITEPFGVWNYYRPSIAIDDAGIIYIAAHDGTNTYIKRSSDYGFNWEDVNNSLGSGIINGTLFYYNGSLYLCGYNGSKIIVRSTSQADYSLDSWGVNTYLEVCTPDAATSRSYCYINRYGNVCVGVENIYGLDYYFLTSVNEGFTIYPYEDIGDDIFMGTGNEFDGECGIAGFKTVDTTNYISYRQGDEELRSEDFGGISEVEIFSLAVASDASPKTCINLNKNGLIAVIGYAGKLDTYKYLNNIDGFVRF